MSAKYPCEQLPRLSKKTAERKNSTHEGIMKKDVPVTDPVELELSSQSQGAKMVRSVKHRCN